MTEFQNAVFSLTDLEDMDTTQKDHALDYLRYWAMSRPRPSLLPLGPDPYAELRHSGDFAFLVERAEKGARANERSGRPGL